MALICNWIIQDVVFDKRLTEMERLLRHKGHNVHVLRNATGIEPIDPPFTSNEPTLAMVSLGIARRLSTRPEFVPGVLCRPEMLKVSTYGAFWGRHLLNDDYVVLPWAEFVRRREIWIRDAGGAESVFVRPNSCEKIFTGQEIPFDDWHHEVRCMESLTGIRPETLVCVSSPKSDIAGEWRFWIANGAVVTHSHYSWETAGQPGAVCPEPPLECIELANALCREPWQPDVAYTADICMTDRGARLVEVNSFSCSGVYEADLSRLIDAGSSVATDEWFLMEPPAAAG
jgi:hypothetical protein